MILFNFSLCNPVLHSSYNNDVYVKFKLTYSKEYAQRNRNLFDLKYFKPSYLISADRNWLLSQNKPELSNISQSKDVIIRNLWQKLVNKYWQETIFISSSNSILDKYTNKLKTSGLSIYEGTDYKNFLSQFSKDLIDRKINLDLVNSVVEDYSNPVNHNNFYIKYKWLKFLNPSVLFMKHHYFKLNNENFLNRFDNSLPLFVLTNNNRQIILAESPDQLSNRHIFLKFYNKITQRGLHNKKLYTGLFFVNHEDAIEYQHYINSKYMQSTRNLMVQPVVTTLNFYYKILSKSSDLVEFRLVPDLNEIGNLVYKYQKYKNLHFDPNQKYGHHHFQGQPIYMIKSLQVQANNNLNNLHYLHPSYNDNNSQGQYNLIFLSYETALSAWKNYQKTSSNINLPTRPNIYVSNLETFIQLSSNVKGKDKFIFLPSLETFNFIKKHLQTYLPNNKSMATLLKNKSLHLKSLCYRTLWSLTTRQPTAW